MFTKYFRKLRNAAVVSYKKAILDCIEHGSSNSNLLDCGCDNGKWTIQLGSKAGDARLFGIEIVEKSAAEAKDRGVNCIRADLNRPLPFASNSMDIIHANQVIEHLSDTDIFVMEIKRILRPGGYAIICTENLSSWHNIFSLLFGWQPFSLTNICAKKFQIGNPLAIHNQEPNVNPNSWQHLKIFAFRGLKELFEEYGFRIEKIIGSGYYPLPDKFGKFDPRHAAFLTIKVRNPE